VGDIVEASLRVEVVKRIKFELETASDESLLSNLVGADWWKNRLSEARAWEHFIIVPVSWRVSVVSHAFSERTPVSWHFASLCLDLRKTSANIADDSGLCASGRVTGRPLADFISWNISRTACNGPALCLVALVDWFVDVLGTRAEWVTGNVHTGTFDWSVICWHGNFVVAVNHLFSSWNDGKSALVFEVAFLLSSSAHANALVTLVGSYLWAFLGFNFRSLIKSSHCVFASAVTIFSSAYWASESHLWSWAVSGACGPCRPISQWERWSLAGLGLNIISHAAIEVFS